jgi:Flp pilus assembly protein CpaB
MTYRTRNILIASALALTAAVFMMVYISKVRDDTDLGRKLVSVFVAAHDIDEGTPGSSLSKGSLVEKRVPLKATVPGYISAPTEVDGLIATQKTLAGEQVTVRRFGPLEAAGVRAVLRTTQRAIQFAGTANQVLDGTLEAGDHVDILATWPVPEGCSSCNKSRTIVRDVLVLKTSSDLGGNGTITSSSSEEIPVQLRLTDAESERVLWVQEHGKWWLSLRPVVKPRSSKQGYDSAESILRNGLQRKSSSR